MTTRGWTLQQSEMRDQILSKLETVPGKKLTPSPNVIQQLRRLCDFPRTINSWEIEIVLERMAMVHLVTYKKAGITILEVSLTDD